MLLPVSLFLTSLISAQAAPVKISGVNASSYYDEGGVRYPASQVKDGYVATQRFEGDRGNGLGAHITLELGSELTVTKVVMYAGDWKSEKDWQRANRPKELEVKFSDESTEVWTLTDEWKPQVFVPKKPTATSSIRFKINQIYNGSAFPDTAISEIFVIDDKPAAVRVSGASASSEFPADNDGAYDASQVHDGVKDTFWCENNKAGDGVGEWIQLDFGGNQRLSGVSVCTGMCVDFANMTAHKKGNVPTALTLQFSDGSTEKLNLKDTFRPQKFPLTPRNASSVKVMVDAVRKGSDFNDACISEIDFN